MAETQKRRDGTRRLRAAIMACVAAAILVLGMASPASAHGLGVPLTSGGVQLGTGGVSADHTRAYACDTRADGNVIFTEYLFNGGTIWSVYDYNHTSSGCGWATIKYCITHFRVCTAVNNSKACGGWVVS